MKIFRSLAFGLVLLSLAGCASLGQVINAAGVATTVYGQVKAVYKDAPLTLFVARAGYDIALGAAANFKTTLCPAVTSHSYCPTVVPLLRSANHRALAALDTAENFIRTHPTLDPASAIAAAEAAITAFAKIETDNGVLPK